MKPRSKAKPAHTIVGPQIWLYFPGARIERADRTGGRIDPAGAIYWCIEGERPEPRWRPIAELLEAKGGES